MHCHSNLVIWCLCFSIFSRRHHFDILLSTLIGNNPKFFLLLSTLWKRNLCVILTARVFSLSYTYILQNLQEEKQTSVEGVLKLVVIYLFTYLFILYFPPASLKKLWLPMSKITDIIFLKIKQFKQKLGAKSHQGLCWWDGEELSTVSEKVLEGHGWAARQPGQERHPKSFHGPHLLKTLSLMNGLGCEVLAVCLPSGLHLKNEWVIVGETNSLGLSSVNIL